MQSSIWAVYQLDDDVYYYNAERLKLNREMEKDREGTPADNDLLSWTEFWREIIALL